MKSTANKLTCAQVKDMDLVNYLSELGYQPKKINGNEYWYLSPLHEEHTASFKVNRNINKWYDFGIGKGGNTLDFGLLYHKCSVSEFLNGMDTRSPALHQPKPISTKPEVKIIVTEVKALSSPALIRYLSGRGIGLDLAISYCSQVHYKLNDKSFYGVGFKNDLGGYEINNAFYKSSSSPKGVTTYKNGAKNLSVFEGFIDFLSFLVLYDKPETAPTDYLILNSLSFFESQRPFMESYNQTHLYLDNDPAGQKWSEFACSKSKVYVRKDHLYDGYNDLNDRLTCKPLPLPVTRAVGKRIS